MPFGSVLVATHPGHSPGGLDLEALPAAWPAEILLRLQPESPIDVLVLDDLDRPQPNATVRHQARTGTAEIYTRFLSEVVATDARGRAAVVPFDGDQTLWAERDGLVSLPWCGRRPSGIVLRLGRAFTVGGSITSGNVHALESTGERRVLVLGQTGNLWRPLATLRDAAAGEWGPLPIPLEGIAGVRVRLEGGGLVPKEESFDPPRSGTHRRVDFIAETGVDLLMDVQDESGQPIDGARAKAWWGTRESTSGPNHIEARSGPDGRIRLGSVPAGTIKFRVSAPGYGFVESEATAPASLLFQLQRGGRIVGRCTHAGDPVEDFQIIYWQSGSVLLHREQSFLGASDGSFELDGLAPVGWSLLAASPRFPSSKPILVEVKADQETRVVLELPDAIRGIGRVVAFESGLPVPSARVQAFSTGASERSFPWGPPVPVDPDGSFDLDAFVLGPNYLSVDAGGFARADVSATAITDELLDWGDIRLHRPQRLRITLVGCESLEGSTPPDHRVYSHAGLEQKRFDPDGVVEYEAVPPGDHEVFITYPDESWSRLHLRLDPGADWAYDFKIAGGRRLELRVLDEDDAPLESGGAVALAAREENGVLVVRLKMATPDGRMHFDGIRAEQVQAYVLDVDNDVLATRDITLADESQGVEIRLGEKPFRVHVVDRKGDPVPGAWVSMRARDGSDFVGIADTDLDGWASIKGLPAGELLMNVQHDLVGKSFGVPVDASAGELEFVLDPAGSIELLVLDGAEPLAGVATRLETKSGITLSDAKESDGRGRVRYDLLGAGTYRFACRRADCWSTFAERPLGAGETATVRVQMRRLAELELVVTDGFGAPLPGVTVELTSEEFGLPVMTWIEAGLVVAHGRTVGADGKLRMAGLPRGPYSWSVPMRDEPLTGSFDLEPGKTNVVRVLVP
jgi:hypothetical protein